ncbi:MAG: hypothetical protein IT384_04365 [Deltaproteobacteria bacterium]|nr:hypothetical protein [Deltaproteobacteria bacterium]
MPSRSDRRTTRRRGWRIGVVLVLALGAGSAYAQSAAQKKSPGRVIKLGDFKIEGQIQKPQAFYILQRSNLNFEGLELKNSFVPKIIKSVEQAPF